MDLFLEGYQFLISLINYLDTSYYLEIVKMEIYNK